MSELFETLSGRHRGLILRSDLLLHASDDQIEWWLRSHRLFPVRRTLYRLPGVHMDWRMNLRAAVLATHPAGYVSHRAAALLWGLRVRFNERLEITVPRGSSGKEEGVVAHTSKRPNSFIAEIDGIPVSSPERTVLELSRHLGDQSLRRVVEDAAIRKVLSIEHLQFTYEALRGKGVPRMSAFKRLLPELNPEIGSADTQDEVRAYDALVNAGLPAPAFRHRMLLDGDPIFMDLVYVDLKINIEMDDIASHDVFRFKRDRQRDRHLELLGWIVLRFPNDAPKSEIIQDVRSALANRAA